MQQTTPQAFNSSRPKAFTEYICYFGLIASMEVCPSCPQCTIFAVQYKEKMYLLHTGNHRQHRSHDPSGLSSHYIWPWTDAPHQNLWREITKEKSSFGRAIEGRHYRKASKHQRIKYRTFTITFRIRGVLCVSSSSLSDLMFLCSLTQTPVLNQQIQGMTQPGLRETAPTICRLAYTSLHFN